MKPSALKVPFPYFGGKSQAAELVWKLLGDTDHLPKVRYGLPDMGKGERVPGVSDSVLSPIFPMRLSW